MGRKKRNNIYNFYEYDENAHSSKCLIDGCSAVIKGKHGANLSRHFLYKHKNEYERIQERNKNNLPGTSISFNNSTSNDILLKNVINLVTIYGITLLDDEAFQNIISLIPMVGTSSINADNIRGLMQGRASELLKDRQSDSNQAELTNDTSDQNKPDGQGPQLLVPKTETLDLDLDPLFETQEVSDSEYSEGMPNEASTSEVKTESRGKSCCINNGYRLRDSCPAHTRLLEAIVSCVSRQEQSAARAAHAQEAQARALETQARAHEQMVRVQESQMRIQEALMRTQEAQTHALEKIARLLEDRPQRL